MKILVIVVGPVQEFIESARKCRDLWFGSWLLSELARAAALGVCEAEGKPDSEVLVFPGAKLDALGQAVANKIVARIQGEPAAVAAAAEGKMRERLREVREAAFARVASGHPRREELFKIEPARDQVDGLIEFLWASVEEKAEGYADSLKDAERLLAAVKNSKHWRQPSWARDGVPKSSLDGVRESVLDESLYAAPRGLDTSKLRAPPSEERLRRSFGVHGSERLCGVGLLKRFGNQWDGGAAPDMTLLKEESSVDRRRDEGANHPERIFSTSHVASGSFRAGLHVLASRRPEKKKSWERFQEKLEQIDKGLEWRLNVVPQKDPVTGWTDGSVFYEGRLIETLEELGYDTKARPGGSSGAREDADVVKLARDALRDFLRSVRELGEPIPYYALLLADGDRMGAVIADQKSWNEHQRLSRELENFASATRTIVKKHGGVLIYAGGDDVLAMLPLHTLLECSQELASGFKKAMESWQIRESDGVLRSPTLSMGIAVVHHLMPLDEALRLVRKTEKVAKKMRYKDALAVVVQKRGGESTEVAGYWGVLDKNLELLVELHRAEAVSVKTQYELMDLVWRLGEKGEDISESMRPVVKAEVSRLLARKRAKQGKEELAKKTREKLEELQANSHPARLGRELYVAQLLARAKEQAEATESKNETQTQEVSS